MPELAIIVRALIGRLHALKSLVKWRHQFPAQELELPVAALRVPADDNCGLRRGDVPAGRQVRQRVGRAEELGNQLGGQLRGKASAHLASA